MFHVGQTVFCVDGFFDGDEDAGTPTTGREYTITNLIRSPVDGDLYVSITGFNAKHLFDAGAFDVFPERVEG